MRNEALSSVKSVSTERLYYLTPKWQESEIDILSMDELARSTNELKEMYVQDQGYDFLFGKTPDFLPDYWAEG